MPSAARENGRKLREFRAWPSGRAHETTQCARRHSARAQNLACRKLSRFVTRSTLRYSLRRLIKHRDFALVACLACGWDPARVDPLIALRAE
jgi:hypothetical protein